MIKRLTLNSTGDRAPRRGPRGGLGGVSGGSSAAIPLWTLVAVAAASAAAYLPHEGGSLFLGCWATAVVAGCLGAAAAWRCERVGLLLANLLGGFFLVPTLWQLLALLSLFTGP